MPKDTSMQPFMTEATVPSGAKAPGFAGRLTAGLKPRPFKAGFHSRLPKRLLHLAILCLTAITLLGAATPAKTFEHAGGKMMCTCGCAEMLLECNHVGCPDSPALIAELHGHVDSGHSEKDILAFFAAKYGPTVLAAPLRGGFDNVAWIMPFAVFALGLLAVILVLQMWKRRQARIAPAIPIPPTASGDALRDRIRDETQYGE